MFRPFKNGGSHNSIDNDRRGAHFGLILPFGGKEITEITQEKGVISALTNQDQSSECQFNDQISRGVLGG